MLNDPELLKKVEAAALKNEVPQPIQTMTNEDAQMMSERSADPLLKNKAATPNTMAISVNNMLAQVVGVILGSPEFQRK
jgi:hypothetical protein